MKSRIAIAAAAAILTLGMAGPAIAWDEIGYQTADGKRDRDVVKVRGAERHKQIRICVEKSPLKMRDLEVVFANGGKQDVQVRQRFEKGSCSRAIDLRGDRRNIDRIVLVYDDKGGDRAAVIKIYAR